MSDLPQGWSEKSIQDLLAFKYGKGLTQEKRKASGGLPVYGSNGIVGKHDHAITEGPTIIVGRKGSVGEVHFSPVKCWPIDTTYFIDEFPDGSPPEYWAFFLRSLQLGQQEKSSAIPGISRQDIYKLKVPVPPVTEQHRIAAKLEELLRKVDACRERLTKVPTLLKRFRQSVLAAACCGRLTSYWRQENPDPDGAPAILSKLTQAHASAGGHKRGNAAEPTDDVHDLEATDFPDAWELAELRNLCEPDRTITYGILKPGPDSPGGVPYVRVADFPNDKLELSRIKRTTKEIDAAYARARLREGDLLLSIRGTVGRVCIVPKELEGGNITQDSARLTIQNSMDPLFVAWFLRAMPSQRRIQKAIKGVAIRGINIGDVRAVQVPIPPLSEQREIVRRVEALFRFADQIEARYKKAQAQVDKMTQSILAKAFRGELVPTEAQLARREGRHYESASVLLERITKARRDGAIALINKRDNRLEKRRQNRTAGRHK